MSDFKLCKWQLKDGLSEIVFKNDKGTRLLINEDNINDELVKMATDKGKGHCFVERKIVELKKKQFQHQYTPVTSTLNEVPTEESDSLPAVENKRVDSLQVEKKKKGRPAKSKE
jgi:hypothetical protein